MLLFSKKISSRTMIMYRPTWFGRWSKNLGFKSVIKLMPWVHGLTYIGMLPVWLIHEIEAGLSLTTHTIWPCSSSILISIGGEGGQSGVVRYRLRKIKIMIQIRSLARVSKQLKSATESEVMLDRYQIARCFACPLRLLFFDVCIMKVHSAD